MEPVHQSETVHVWMRITSFTLQLCMKVLLWKFSTVYESISLKVFNCAWKLKVLLCNFASVHQSITLKVFKCGCASRYYIFCKSASVTALVQHILHPLPCAVNTHFATTNISCIWTNTYIEQFWQIHFNIQRQMHVVTGARRNSCIFFPVQLAHTLHPPTSGHNTFGNFDKYISIFSQIYFEACASAKLSHPLPCAHSLHPPTYLASGQIHFAIWQIHLNL